MAVSSFLAGKDSSSGNYLERRELMNVTDVRIRKITRNEKMKAIVSVTLNDQFVIHDIRIIDGPNGLFVAMPSRKIPGGGFRDVVHPISTEARRHLQQAVLEAYEAELDGYLLQA
jgi:stage V sporulation protein G